MIKVGEVVLLKDDKSARSLWKLAKIEQLIPSWDNEIRAAKVRVVNSDEGRSVMLRRPLQHLIPLEIPPPAKEEDQVSAVKNLQLQNNPVP